jgi:hypothetical protein
LIVKILAPRRLFQIAVLVVLVSSLTAFRLAGAGKPCDNEVRLNQIQVIGSHNSYHAGLGPHEMELLRARNPKAANALSYSHPALDQQLNDGVRQIELDIYADAKGGLYSHPAWPKLMADAGIARDPDFDPQHMFDKPGFKVMHVQDLDYRSNCQPFIGCLQTVRRWSRAHPGHLPIFILLETKESREHPEFMTLPEAFTAEVFDALDAEIRSVFSEEEMITPDQVRGARSTLEEAVLKDGWPCLQRSLGKVVFLMDQRKVSPIYSQGHPALRNRVIFTNARPGEPDAAFVEVNDPQMNDPQMNDPQMNGPQHDTPSIPDLIKKGYIVRTRADADLQQGKANGIAIRDAALASGAQMVSTDFPFVEKSADGYAVVFPRGETSRCNPVNAPANCNTGSLRAHEGKSSAVDSADTRR